MFICTSDLVALGDNELRSIVDRHCMYEFLKI